MRRIPIALIFFIISFNVPAKDTIYWAQYDMPPFYIKDGSYSGKGIDDITDSMIRKQLPQYNHIIIWANVVRIKKMMNQGKDVVCGNMLKTPEREKYQIFSNVSRMLPTAPHVIIPSSQIDSYKKYMVDGDGIDLLRLIQSKDKIGYFIIARSYGGSDLNLAIQNKKNKKVSYSFNAPMNKIFDMLLRDVNGFTIAFPEELTYHIETKYGYYLSTSSDLNKKNYRNKFKVIPIAGNQKSILTYVAAPKNEWGYKVMSDINNVLIKLKSNPDYINENYMWRDSI